MLLIKMDVYTICLILCITTLQPTKALRSVNVFNFGAVGDGNVDDSNAFMKAWQAACGATEEVSLVIPAQKTFLLKPVKFVGPCKSPQINIWVEGNIVAPRKISDWSTPYMGTWIVFIGVNNVSVVGKGQIDGRGSAWWQCTNQCRKPLGLKFHSCKNVEINGLQIKNTPMKFLSVSDCDNVIISNLNITNPENSFNTDGMDITHSTHVRVADCHISTGDDCIAILSGSSNINITGVFCWKGHGISIGSMGGNGDYDTVEEVYVQHCHFGSSTNGARIKTWQGGSGFVRKVYYEDITLQNTSNPIVIDQFYCPEHNCANKTKAVTVSDISFLGFHGTSFTETAIKVACSQTLGCSNIVMDDINITSSAPNRKVTSYCFNAKGTFTSTSPKVNC